MKHIFQVTLICYSLVIASIAQAAPKESAEHKATSEVIHGIIKNLIDDNNKFAGSQSKKEFLKIKEGQTPRATVVMCADSRVHKNALDDTPVNDLFTIRNIGNQLETAEGSIEFGIDHLHTPLLMFIGHTNCGAVKAAAGDYSALSKAIKSELDTMKITKDIPVTNGVVMNVQQQVEKAMKKFEGLIKEDKLTVVGAVYDLSNELGHGFGKLVLVDINGEKDAAKIKELPLLKGIKNISIGHKE